LDFPICRAFLKRYVLSCILRICVILCLYEYYCCLFIFINSNRHRSDRDYIFARYRRVYAPDAQCDYRGQLRSIFLLYFLNLETNPSCRDLCHLVRSRAGFDQYLCRHQIRSDAQFDYHPGDGFYHLGRGSR
jgi:hypothetical protein